MKPADTEARLLELKAEVQRESAQRRKEAGNVTRPARRARAREIAIAIAVVAAKVAVIVVLPFVVLVRTSVDAYRLQGFPVWLALLFGAVLTLLVVAAYAAWLSRAVTGKARFVLMAKWVALPLVLGYCVYALAYVSEVNAKSQPVRAYYTSVHPLLRLALSTLILADGDMVITDMRREPDDYARMGLPENERTRHYRQRDGWVHAVDLRTAGQGAVKNRLVQLYFWMMGFRTLRHEGTADHLHVQLR